MTVFYSFLPTTVHTGAPAHDGLGRAALVRRFKTLLNRRTRLHEHFSRGSLREQLATSLTRHLSKYLLRQPNFVHGEGVP
jgi:hypothetical protein